jgi:hypothetical protein
VFRDAPDADPKEIERINLKLARIYAFKLNQIESAGKQVNWPAKLFSPAFSRFKERLTMWILYLCGPIRLSRYDFNQ